MKTKLTSDNILRVAHDRMTGIISLHNLIFRHIEKSPCNAK